MPFVVVLSRTVHPVTPVGSDWTRLFALRVKNMTSRSPADVVAGTVTFGVVTLPWLVALATKLTVVGPGGPTTVTDFIKMLVSPSSSLAVNATLYVPGWANEWLTVTPLSAEESPKSQPHPTTEPSGSVDVEPSNVQSRYVQVAVNAAVGGTFGTTICTTCEEVPVAPWSSVTVRLTE